MEEDEKLANDKEDYEDLQFIRRHMKYILKKENGCYNIEDKEDTE